MHQLQEVFSALSFRQFSFRIVEPSQIFLWKINTPGLKIFPNIPNDVGHLQRKPEIDGVFPTAWIAITEDLYADQSNRAGDSVTINAKLFKSGISHDAQIHFHPGNDLLQHARLKRIFMHQLPDVPGK